jgi:hypothetical protein
MQIELIGDYEATCTPGASPTLVLHHLVRGYDAVVLDADATAELAELLATQQKRIRPLASYNAILGTGGDLTLYTASGQRACYLNGDQAARLGGLLARCARAGG